MKRETWAVATVAVGLAGLLAFQVLPWVGYSDGPGNLMHFSYWFLGLVPEGDDTIPMVRGLQADLTWALHGFAWGTLVAVVALLGYALRPLHRGLGELLVLVGCLAVLAGIPLALGHALFFSDLSDAAALVPEGTNFGFGGNIASPLLAAAFVGAAGTHAALAVGPAVRGLQEGEPTRIRVATEPPAGGAVTGLPPPPGPLILLSPRIQERLDAARRAVRDHAAKAGPHDPAAAAWQRQMEGYLAELETLARTHRDEATQERVLAELDRHVFSLAEAPKKGE